MARPRELLASAPVTVGGQEGTLLLWREDCTGVYPGLFLYTLELACREASIPLFRTNTYEYAPGVPLDAETVARRRMQEWLERIPGGDLDMQAPLLPREGRRSGLPEVLVIQGSPRPDGNCSMLCSWVEEEAAALGRTVEVIFPADMEIRACIGCYQCYNTGICTFDDDMAGVIDSIRVCRLLVVCSPVYTNTVPGDLKLLIDRCQAYHASCLLHGRPSGQRGIIISVAGRTGTEPFECVVKVLEAFMRNLGIVPSGQLLLGGMDRVRNVGMQQGVRERLRELVKEALIGSPSSGLRSL